jgi:hypothetical protein
MSRPILFDILVESHRRVGKKFYQPDTWVQGWQDEYTWSQADRDAFLQWVIDYLDKDRGKLDRYKLKRMAKDIVDNYGWKIE